MVSDDAIVGGDGMDSATLVTMLGWIIGTGAGAYIAVRITRWIDGE